MVDPAHLASSFAIGYTTLISIINPFGVAFIFHDMTRSLEESQRQWMALRIAIYSFAILVISSVMGTYILSFFGISIAALRIAGGTAVAFAGWTLLNRPDSAANEADAPATPPAADIASMAFYPLTMPLTTGPGSVAAAIALVVNGPFGADRFIGIVIQVVIVAVAVCATIYVCYRWSGWLSRHLGVAATRIFMRVAAFLLLCVGVQIIITGVLDVIRTAQT